MSRGVRISVDGKGRGGTTYSLTVCGEASSTRKSTSKPTTHSGRLVRTLRSISPITTTGEGIRAEAERLIAIEEVPVIAGGYSSSHAFAASDVCEKHKTVFWITTGVGDPITSRGYKILL
jgi:hypothetical protein